MTDKTAVSLLADNSSPLPYNNVHCLSEENPLANAPEAMERWSQIGIFYVAWQIRQNFSFQTVVSMRLIDTLTNVIKELPVAVHGNS